MGFEQHQAGIGLGDDRAIVRNRLPVDQHQAGRGFLSTVFRSTMPPASVHVIACCSPLAVSEEPVTWPGSMRAGIVASGLAMIYSLM
jgi:hypothetical protein